MASQPHDDPKRDRTAEWTDERVDRVIGNLLRVGVLASALVVCAGGVLLLAREGRAPAPDLSEFRPEREALRAPAGVLRESLALRRRALIMLGLLLLIATPVARVLFSVVAFALQRDYLYVIFTLVVFAVLLYSLFSGYFS